MSRSYHVTEKKANTAFSQGDTEPAYQASEKRWVKKQSKAARVDKRPVTNRAIVSNERKRTSRVR